MMSPLTTPDDARSQAKKLARKLLIRTLVQPGGWTMSKARRFLREDGGASAGEYALILAIIGVGAVIAALTLGDTIALSLSQSSLTIASAGSSDNSGSPGQSGSAPGQTGDTPGLSGATPGQSGAAAPGQSGNTPGQSGSAPGRNK
jgi:Flp pilus assembly pilin Flp